MLIDGPITTQTIDSSGEILDLKGLDISDFLDGKATANFEHNNDNADDVLGWFIYAKKIFSEADCENDRQRMFWDKVKTPFLYGVLELLDDASHPGAIAVAAMLRYFKKKNEPVKIGMSIEGSTLERDGHILKRTVGRKVAITLRPCNKQCMLDVLPQERTDELIQKMESDHIQSFEVDSPILEKSEFVKSSAENSDIVKLYHITDKAKFKLNQNYSPIDNSISIEDRSGRKGIYTTPSVEKWITNYGYARPFVAELHVPKSLMSEKNISGRWGGEIFIPSEYFDKIKVHRVIPTDAHAREINGDDYGPFEEAILEEFDTGKPITNMVGETFKVPKATFRNYKYSGKDARKMSSDEIKQIKQHFKRGYKAYFGKSEENLIDDIKQDLINLRKTLTAGMGNAAPSMLTGGSALATEDKRHKTNVNVLKSVIRDFQGKTKEDFKKAVKEALPDLSDKYVDHFVDLAEDLSLKKFKKRLY